MFECKFCHTDENTTYIDSIDEYVCPDCIENELIKCDKCGDYIHNGYAWRMQNGDDICDSCYEKYGYQCENCGEDIYRADCHEVHGGYVCHDCFQDYEQCDVCGDWVGDCEDGEDAYGDCIRICTDCITYNSSVYTCPECDTYVFDPDYNNEGYCFAHDPSRTLIHDYCYKPTPVFHPFRSTDTVYMGVELEVDGMRGRRTYVTDGANAVNDIMDGFVYLKHDGSLDDGFEIVSHPATMEYHTVTMAEKWQKAMEACVENGLGSHNTSTCGLHVHVSIAPLEASDPGIVGKLLYIVDKHWDNIVKFSRRTTVALNRYAKRYAMAKAPNRITAKNIKNQVKSGRDRFMAINVQNEHTIEFRVFRGTLKWQTFAATLQFIHVILERLKETSYGDLQYITWGNLTQSDYPELNAYLHERELYEEPVPIDAHYDDETNDQMYYIRKDAVNYPFGKDEENPPCVIMETYGRLNVVYFENPHRSLHRGNGISGGNHCFVVDVDELVPAGGVA